MWCLVEIIIREGKVGSVLGGDKLHIFREKGISLGKRDIQSEVRVEVLGGGVAYF